MFYMNVKFLMNVGFCAEDLDVCGNRIFFCKSLKVKLGFRQRF
jgi:hypothetical protein